MENRKRNDGYIKKKYSWMQVRDCVEGSDAVKRKKELYLPMPTGMQSIDQAYSVDRGNNTGDFDISEAPWYHTNPAYRAYLQRATFPDFVGSIVRGLSGTATNNEPEIKMNADLETIQTVDGQDLQGLFKWLVSEVAQVGKACVVVDPQDDGSFKLVTYSTERNIDWEMDVIDGERVLTRVSFIETFQDMETDQGEEVIEYFLNDEGLATIQRYKNDKKDGDEIELMYRGKQMPRLPCFFVGSIDNTPEPDDVPMLGVSDNALAYYRKDADQCQAHFMTCNPTLFIFGVNEDQKPSMIGSQVVVGISNPNARAEYPATDTSALVHIQDVKKDLQNLAISMGVQLFVTGKKNAESAEALAIRKASSGATLVDFVVNSGNCIEDALDYINIWRGSAESVTFEPSTKFAEEQLSPQDITAIVSSWVQGAISHDTLLDKFRDASIVSGAVTNKKEKARIMEDAENRFDMAQQFALDGDDDEGDDKDNNED